MIVKLVRAIEARDGSVMWCTRKVDLPVLPHAGVPLRSGGELWTVADVLIDADRQDVIVAVRKRHGPAEDPWDRRELEAYCARLEGWTTASATARTGTDAKAPPHLHLVE